ncbi:hypothetical protein MPSEU_001091300 [Mayamaea pseudoterrestris]|nr:hypothetical protein MPSEU_001091300 [Mayamaea pseudoterrestris]
MINQHESSRTKEENQRKELINLVAENDRRWKHLQSLLLSNTATTSNAPMSCQSNEVNEAQSSFDNSFLNCMFQAEAHLMQTSPHSEWKIGIERMRQKLLQQSQSSHQSANCVDDEIMRELDRELVHSYHDSLETSELTVKELEREMKRLHRLEYQLQELQELKEQLEASRVEQEEETLKEPLIDGPNAHAVEHEQLRNDLIHICSVIDKHQLNPPPPAPTFNERLLRQHLDSPEHDAFSPSIVPFHELVLELIHRLATHDKEEDQYLQVRLLNIDDSSNLANDSAGVKAPSDITDGPWHHPRHVEFLLDLCMAEAFEDNASLVRLLPEYRDS